MDILPEWCSLVSKSKGPSWELNPPSVGSVHMGVVTGVEKGGAWVHLSAHVRGWAPKLELNLPVGGKTSDVSPFDYFAPGMAVRVVVHKVDVARHRLDLSLCLSRAAREIKSEDLPAELGEEGLDPPMKEGSTVWGRINLKRSALKPPAAMVDLPGHVSGRLCVTEIAEPEEWHDGIMARYVFVFHISFTAQSEWRGARGRGAFLPDFFARIETCGPCGVTLISLVI